MPKSNFLLLRQIIQRQLTEGFYAQQHTTIIHKKIRSMVGGCVGFHQASGSSSQEEE